MSAWFLDLSLAQKILFYLGNTKMRVFVKCYRILLELSCLNSIFLIIKLGEAKIKGRKRSETKILQKSLWGFWLRNIS